METRKFLVHNTFQIHEKEYDSVDEIVLNPGEKANAETFKSKLDFVGDSGTKFDHSILSWSLIEE